MTLINDIEKIYSEAKKELERSDGFNEKITDIISECQIALAALYNERNRV